MSAPAQAPLAERLICAAQGNQGREAAVWLLVSHGHWIEEIDRLGAYTVFGGDAPLVAWECLTSDRAVATASEWHVLKFARALAEGAPVDLTSLGRVDEVNVLSVLHAMAWAARGEEWAASLHLIPNSP